jgi:aspartyl-tRNA(Asn)/glutamyl-tRNA(Gln) amidotransferase subunit B
VDAAWIARIRDELPELPAARRARYVGLGLSAYDAGVLGADPGMRAAFEAVRATGAGLPAKEVANFVTGLSARTAKDAGYNAAGVPGAARPADVARLLGSIVDGTVTRPVGRELLERHLADGTPAADLLASAGPGPSADEGALLAHVGAVIAANPQAVADYRAGKPVAGFFVGQVMKATAGAADAASVTRLVRERLDAEG